MILDAHHHFWDYDAEAYPWIGPGMEVLQRDYGPAELAGELEPAGVDGVISVQARASLAENAFLLERAREAGFVRGVVGWADLTDPRVEDVLARHAAEPLMRGFRHPLQDEADPRYMLREDFQEGVGRLARHGFCYEILIHQEHLVHVPAFADRHPDLPLILDHAAKPRIESDVPPGDWVRGIGEVARRERVWCKLSGLVTEVRPGVVCTADLLRPYVEAVLEAFGPGRILFGSDWPVCLLAGSYAGWWALVRELLAELSAGERDGILGGNAVRAYGLAGDLAIPGSSGVD